MANRARWIIIGMIVPLSGAFGASAPEKSPPVRYRAEFGVPKDRAAEIRRDYAVLEAALNDMADPKNPEHRTRVENKGPGREIVIGNQMLSGDVGVIDVESVSHDSNGKDPQRIPIDIQEDFNRRGKERGRSLNEFKPANSNILVRDLDKLFDESDDPIFKFIKDYPTAWGYVWAYPPGYSKDGTWAFVAFAGGPNGGHPLDWDYLLKRDRNRWIVLWRHCHAWE